MNDPSAFDDAIVDAPGSVLTLFTVATAPADADELVGLDVALTAFGCGAAGSVAVASRRPWGRIAAVFGVASLVTFGAAAAAGSLPDSAQRVVSNGFGRIGIDVPSPDDVTTVDDSPAGTGTDADDQVSGTAGDDLSNGNGATAPPNGTTPAGITPSGVGTVSPGAVSIPLEVKRGLCRGWFSSQPQGSALDATSREELLAAAAIAGQDVATFCASLGVAPPSDGSSNRPVKPSTPATNNGGVDDDGSSSSSAPRENGSQGDSQTDTP